MESLQVSLPVQRPEWKRVEIQRDKQKLSSTASHTHTLNMIETTMQMSV